MSPDLGNTNSFLPERDLPLHFENNENLHLLLLSFCIQEQNSNFYSRMTIQQLITLVCFVLYVVLSLIVRHQFTQTNIIFFYYKS